MIFFLPDQFESRGRASSEETIIKRKAKQEPVHRSQSGQKREGEFAVDRSKDKKSTYEDKVTEQRVSPRKLGMRAGTVLAQDRTDI